MSDRLYFIFTEEEYQIIKCALEMEYEFDVQRKLEQQYEENKKEHKLQPSIPKFLEKREGRLHLRKDIRP